MHTSLKISYSLNGSREEQLTLSLNGFTSNGREDLLDYTSPYDDIGIVRYIILY